MSLFLFFFPFISISWRLITLQYCSGFVIHWHESAMDLHVFPIPIPLPTSLSTRSLWVFPVHQPGALVSCIQSGLVICFMLGNIHVLILNHWISREVPSRHLFLHPQLLFSAVRIQDFGKMMPFILMRVRWPADEVTTITFSLTGWLVLTNSGPRQPKFLSVFFGSYSLFPGNGISALWNDDSAPKPRWALLRTQFCFGMFSG